MAKSNVNTNTEVVKQPETEVQPVQDATGNADAAQTAEGEVESSEEKLPDQPESGNGKETDDKGNPEVDSEGQDETIGKEGDNVEIHVVDEPKQKTESRKKIASEVFSKHANCKVLYFTSDLIPFFEEGDAYVHTRILKDQTVVTFNKE